MRSLVQQWGLGRKTIIVLLASMCIAALPAPTDKEIIDSPLYKPAPEYPERALEVGIEGAVRLSVTVAPDGRVTNVTVVSADPEGWFEEAAVDAVKKWKYRAPRRELTFEIAIDFTLP